MFLNLPANFPQLHGAAAEAAKLAGIKSVIVSISHSDSQAIAVAVSKY
jgi:fatty acid synthase subunit alpha